MSAATRNGKTKKAKTMLTYVDDKGARRTKLDDPHPLANCSPRTDRVIVRRDQKEKESKGGILLPTTSDGTKRQLGTIIAIGPGKLKEDGSREEMDLELGDRVVLTGYAGLEISEGPFQEKEEFVMLREDDITAVLDA